jgi:hypothetical protein
MAERPLRLGDVIDDYCPRCRLLLNHDVASIAGAEVARTTCRTCFDTHDYRHGQKPQRRGGRRKEEPKDLVAQVLAGLPLPPPAPPAPEPEPEPAVADLRERAAPTVHRRGNLWAELERIRKK